MAITEEVWLPREVHNIDRRTTYRNDGECWCLSGSLGFVQCHKWGLVRLYTGPYALLHLPTSNARRRFSRPMGWRLHTVKSER